MIFYVFVGLIILQRVIELGIARRNEKWMKKQGAIEVGKDHYKYLVLLHIFFFVSLIYEVIFYDKSLTFIWPVWGVLFLGAQIMRAWCLQSLGMFWNTKIIVLPNVKIISKGPYKYIRHPNYLIVAVEIFVIPMMFNAFITAALFSILNAMALSLRVPVEEKALMQVTNYNKVFASRSRFAPQKTTK